MFVSTKIVVFCFLAVLLSQTEGDKKTSSRKKALSFGNWWFLGVTKKYENPARDRRAKDNSVRCNIPYLVPRQRQMCYRDADLLGVLSYGSALGIAECKSQFSDRHWNCTTYKEANVFGRVAKLKSRETAFIYAIQSAGMMFAVTRSCAKGELRDCGCDPNINYVEKPDTFTWGGCSENIDHGEQFSREFVDSQETKIKPSGRMNLWNNEAGRMAIKTNMKLLCKCHGVSGSCSVKVCWRTMEAFNILGKKLKEHFDGATLVKYSRRKKVLRPRNKYLKTPTTSDLVYLSTSQVSFCKKDPKIGSLGTVGRRCNKTSEGLDSCTIMCCGRGYNMMIRDITEDCNCKFVWCCDVVCQTCRYKLEHQYCK